MDRCTSGNRVWARLCASFNAKFDRFAEESTKRGCLFLNVVTPARMPTDKLPVMVWIHGGGFMGRTGASDLYPSEPLSKRGVVLVTLNYRLNVFGFFAHSGLTAESKQQSSGNYGLLDQIAALKWVKANIAAFGGDPVRFTIFGVSAGGSAV